MTKLLAPPLCSSCTRFRGFDSTHPSAYCAAFPLGIPDAIIVAGFDHRLPFPGDNGIRYDFDSAAQPVYVAWANAHHDTVAKAWDSTKHPRGQPANAGEFASEPGGSEGPKTLPPDSIVNPIPISLIAPQAKPVTGISPTTHRPFPEGKGPQENFNATRFSTFPPALQKKLLKTLHDQSPRSARFDNGDVVDEEPLTPAIVAVNLEAAYNHALHFHWEGPEHGGHYVPGPDRVAIQARDWYDHANQIAVEAAYGANIPLRSGIGMVAALSPQVDWDSNVAMAKFYGAQLRHDEETNGPLKHMTPEQGALELRNRAVAHNLKTARIGISTGEPVSAQLTTDDSTAKAIRIFRGEDPDDVLGGHKVRSFFNNMADPHNLLGGDDVAIDTHMLAAAMAQRIGSKSPYMKPMFSAAGASTHENVSGTYGIFADAVRDLARKNHMEPNQMQAIIWTHWQTVKGEEHRGYREDFPVPIPTPEQQDKIDDLKAKAKAKLKEGKHERGH